MQLTKTIFQNSAIFIEKKWAENRLWGKSAFLWGKRINSFDTCTWFLCCIPQGFSKNNTFDEVIAEICSRYSKWDVLYKTISRCKIHTLEAASCWQLTWKASISLVNTSSTDQWKRILTHCKLRVWSVPSACAGHVMDSPSVRKWTRCCTCMKDSMSSLYLANYGLTALTSNASAKAVWRAA